MTTELVIVGGGPAAHHAAKAYRKAGGAGDVVVLSDDDSLPYDRPPLSKAYLSGESDESGLPLESPDFYSDNDIEWATSDPVTEIDAGERRLTTAGGRVLTYRNCILATGCAPAPLGVDGGDTAYLLRHLRQARALREAAQQAGSAIVIGSGFIGCEAATSLAGRGIPVTMLTNEKQPQLSRLGAEAASRIVGWLEDAGVKLRSEVEITSIDHGHRVMLADGSEYSADLVLSATGVKPRIELAEQAGAEIRDHRIVVDSSMRTSVPGLFAAGDVVAAHNDSASRHLAVEHWSEAERMGDIAGTVAAGGDDSWSNVPGFWSDIGRHTLKYAAWGDGFDESRFIAHSNGGFTVWYAKDGLTVGVLTSEADDDYERGEKLVELGRPLPG